MKITEAEIDGQKFWAIQQDDHGVYLQRRGIRSASENPLGYYEELICRMAEALARPEGDALWVPIAAGMTLGRMRAVSSAMFPWECTKEATSRAHVEDMLARLERGEIIGAKAHRWLGWAQGVICEKTSLALEDLKAINKAASDAARSPQEERKP